MIKYMEIKFSNEKTKNIIVKVYFGQFLINNNLMYNCIYELYQIDY